MKERIKNKGSGKEGMLQREQQKKDGVQVGKGEMWKEGEGEGEGEQLWAADISIQTLTILPLHPVPA